MLGTMKRHVVWVLALGGCALHAHSPDDGAGMRSRIGSAAKCASPPVAGTTRFRHLRSRIVARLGAPRHRGTDVIAVDGDAAQTLSGKLAYAVTDSDLTGEDVAVFACVDDAWKLLGETRSDGNGRFALSVSGGDRLPIGMRDVYAHVRGDGSGVRFLAYVAKPGEAVIVTDVDGTLTESENAILRSVVFGDDIGHRIGAPEALARSGRTIVYLTARGDQFTELTRRWLRDHGFPSGPLRLARAAITRPGAPTVEFKTRALRGLVVPIDAAIGNKQTDIQAYAGAGVPASRIFVKLPEFESELRDDLSAGRAIGFFRYPALPALVH